MIFGSIIALLLFILPVVWLIKFFIAFIPVEKKKRREEALQAAQAAARQAEVRHLTSYAPAGYYHPKDLTPEQEARWEAMRVRAKKSKEDRAEAIGRSIGQYIIGKVAGEVLWDIYSKYVK